MSRFILFRSKKKNSTSTLTFFPSSSFSSTPEKKKHQVNVLVVGSGGREHALSWKLGNSPRCGSLFCAPANAGIALEPAVTAVPTLDVADNAAVVSWC